MSIPGGTQIISPENSAKPRKPTSSPGSANSESQHGYTNRLIREKSPYLLLHAHNPVDWYPWGEEAFAKARRENKPIFLSEGLLHLPLVPRDGARVLFQSSDRRIAEPFVRFRQGRSRRTSGHRQRVHELRRGIHWKWRVADERLLDSRSKAILRRNVFPTGGQVWRNRSSHSAAAYCGRVEQAARRDHAFRGQHHGEIATGSEQRGGRGRSITCKLTGQDLRTNPSIV